MRTASSAYSLSVFPPINRLQLLTLPCVSKYFVTQHSLMPCPFPLCTEREFESINHYTAICERGISPHRPCSLRPSVWPLHPHSPASTIWTASVRICTIRTPQSTLRRSPRHSPPRFRTLSTTRLCIYAIATPGFCYTDHPIDRIPHSVHFISSTAFTN